MQLSRPQQEERVLQQIEREVRMQEGAYKLLAACSRRDQALEVSKSLLTCNARILALLGQLQRMRRARILEREGHGKTSEDAEPCTGKVSLSDLRIPLMWKDSEYFKNKGELHRCAVFCLLQCGSDIHDTDLVMVDRTLTDICFEDAVVFDKVGPGFSLRVEFYSCCAAEDFPPAAPAPAPRRMSFLGGSLGRSSGKKIRAAFESASACGSVCPGGGTARPGHVSPPSALGPKYNLLAQTTLTIEHVREGFKTHDLTLSATDSPFWLPLFGNMCCRFVAQPLCMTQPVMRGQLKIKLEDDADRWGNFYCVLKGQTLLCYRSGEDSESEDEPLHVIPITKDTTVCTSESHPVHGLQISIRMQPDRENATYAAATQNAEDLPGWNKALQQHVYNLSQWKRCCDEVMKIEAPRSRKPKTARQGSLFHEMAISHPDRDTAAGRRLLPFSSPAVFRPGRNGQEHDE
ncbi:rhotekin-like isoform X2 [Poeciliopsis prolifica]|uniref:rhotekin-like isoform X2 n=1 Tax=Poeciliopsis prolifica TaxID=188132 RepID=UPI0024137457|nr:rhotekin-like isoform X2 [Poeciliopsis prolifica]